MSLLDRVLATFVTLLAALAGGCVGLFAAWILVVSLHGSVLVAEQSESAPTGLAGRSVVYFHCQTPIASACAARAQIK